MLEETTITTTEGCKNQKNLVHLPKNHIFKESQNHSLQ